MLKGDDFKQFAVDLRTKSSIYKDRKQELAGATTEAGVLQRTLEILHGKVQSLRNVLGKDADALTAKVRCAVTNNGISDFIRNRPRNFEVAPKSISLERHWTHCIR